MNDYGCQAFVYSFIINQGLLMDIQAIILCSICLLLVFPTNSQILNSWASPLSTVTMHATFITAATQGSTITGSVAVSGNQSFTVYFYRPNEYYPNSAAFQFTEYKGNSTFNSRPVDTTGLWRIEIVPMNANENFIILVTVGSGQNAQRYVQVARRKKLLVGYFQAGESCNFTVQGISPDQARDFQIEMYLGSSSLDFALVSPIFRNSGMTNTEYDVACTASSTGYYYIFLSVSESIMALFPRIWVNYQSDIYPCPAPSIFKDNSQLFPNCVQFNQDAAYPCISYDYNVNACTQCQSDYILEEGKCYLRIDCGLDRYFHVGGCFDAPSYCMSFNQIGGKCTKCLDGFSLTNTVQGTICKPNSVQTSPSSTYVPASQPSGTQQTQNISGTQKPPFNNVTSIPNPLASIPNNTLSPQITCDSGTYLFQGLCVLFPPHCRQFDPIQLICTKCASLYTIDPKTLSCIPISINCPPFNTNIGNICIPFPIYCASTNAFGNCTSCIVSYTLDDNGNCNLKKCPSRQYLSFNDCLPVDIHCDAYDPYVGSCLSCLNNYVLSSNGTCNPPQYRQITTNGCQPRQYRSGNTCNNVDPKCNLFDQYTGFCLSCADPNKFLDKSNGKCYNREEICADRYYLDSITKTCMQVSPYCDKYDSSTGYCLSCTSGLTLFRGGCLMMTPCQNNQYRSQDGSCVDADPNCKGVDQSTGGCLDCQQGYELNPGGVCCYAQNYLLSEACKVFLSANCISQRPVFLNCQQCSPGYSLLNGVFGKCLKRY